MIFDDAGEPEDVGGGLVVVAAAMLSLAGTLILAVLAVVSFL
jgi:hypothetical protein